MSQPVPSVLRQGLTHHKEEGDFQALKAAFFCRAREPSGTHVPLAILKPTIRKRLRKSDSAGETFIYLFIYLLFWW
jgi:hypothetical protein